MIKSQNQMMGILKDAGVSYKQQLDAKDMFVLTTSDTWYRSSIGEFSRSRHFVIALVLRGSIKFGHNSVSYSLAHHTLFLFLPEALTIVYEQSPDFSYVCLGFTKEFLEALGISVTSAQNITLSSTNLQIKFDLDEDELSQLIFGITSLRKKISLPPQTPFKNEAIRYGFLSTISDFRLIFFRYNNPPKQGKFSRKEELTIKFIDLLTANYRKYRCVQYYANTLFVSSKHLSNIVKEITGKTAGKIINDMVIKEAKVLLVLPQLSIKEVTEILNFGDQSIFGKYFKKNTGLSPSQFRIERIEI